MSAGVCNPNDYMDADVFRRVRERGEGVETPALIIDMDCITRSYDSLQDAFKTASIFYAMKANPAVEICQALFDKGASFDIASIYELDRALGLKGMKECIERDSGIATRLSYGNTIKKARDVRYAYSRGVRLFATDSEADIRNIAKAAPGSKVFVRIVTEGSATADWPLSTKFGCHPDMAMDLLILARELGLVPHGISFHVGSQQREIAAWDAAIAKVKVIFERLREEDGIILKLINLGGGFPANYLQRTNSLDVYAAEILRFIDEDFGDQMPEIILEPGRSLVANAGVIVSEIVLVSRKSRFAVDRWVFTDVGKFNGLIETLDEAIKYPIWTPRHKNVVVEEEEVVIAGPTCDSADVMYQTFRYKLPLNLCSGDKLYFMSTGAYTASYASQEFNGFPPIRTYFI